MGQLDRDFKPTDYSLSFLRAEGTPFSSVMKDFIKQYYSHLLEPEDFALMEQGPEGLEKISAKYMAKYQKGNSGSTR